jgi:diguanylate cyclase (GGDEF)-like protein
VFSSEHARAAFADEQRIIATGQSVTVKTEQETFSDHPSAWVSSTKMALRDEGGQIIGTFGISRDITAQIEALLFIDLDNFKEINDSFGHDAGDLVLTEIGRRLTSIARRSDTIARLGGDEFVVLCPELDERAGLEDIGRRIVGTIAAPYIDNGRNLSVTCSVGIAVTSDPATEADRMIRDADLTMFEAKRAGRGRSQPGHPER